MSTCHEMRNRLLMKQSGEYEEGLMGPLAEHLASCAECRRFEADLAHLSAVAPTALEEDAPLRIRRIEPRSRPMPFPLSVFWGRPLMGTAAAAVFLVALLGLRAVLFRPSLPPDDDSSSLLLASLPSRESLLREWQYWMGYGAGNAGEHAHPMPLIENGWSPSEMAQQLLIFEGLGPDVEWGVEEIFWVEEPFVFPQDARAIGSSSQQVV